MKFIKLIILLLSSINHFVFTKDITINFIKKYIAQENKPTFFVSSNLCWNKNDKMNLFKNLSSEGIRSSLDYTTFSYLQIHAILFFVDMNCPNAANTINDYRYLRFPYRWLAISKQNETDIQILWELPLLIDSDFVLAEREGDNFKLSELYKASPKGPTYNFLNFSLRGYYNGTLTDVRTKKELFRRRQDIMGHPLTMANVIQDSNSSRYHLPREDRLELKYDSFAKVAWMNVRIAFEMLNATPQYIFSYRFGIKRNGTWLGMINDIVSGRADIGTNCGPNRDRLSAVDFTDNIAKYKVRFIFRQPPLAYVANIFALPFSFNTWMALFVSLIVSILSIYFATRWENTKNKPDPSQLDGSVGDAILLTLSAFSQQGCSKEPKSASGRIMLWMVFTSLMALYAAYSANVVVLLQASSSSIQTLAHLAHSDLALGALDTDYNHLIFKGQTDPVRRQIHRKLEPENAKGNFYNLDEGVEKIRKGLFAFHATSEQVFRNVEKTFFEIEKCDLMEIDYMNILAACAPVRKHSPYREFLTTAFKRIHEVGIRDALTKRVNIPKPRCSETAAFASVGFLNIRPLVYFMLYGVAMSVVLLVLEILINKITRFEY